MAGSVSGGVNWGCRHIEQNLKQPFIRAVNMRVVRGKIQWTWEIKFVSTQQLAAYCLVIYYRVLSFYMLHFAGDFNGAFLSSRDSFTLCSSYGLIPCLVFVLCSCYLCEDLCTSSEVSEPQSLPSASYGGGGVGVTNVFELCFIFHCHLKEIFVHNSNPSILECGWGQTAICRKVVEHDHRVYTTSAVGPCCQCFWVAFKILILSCFR